MKRIIAVFITILGTSPAFAQSLSDAMNHCRSESNSLKRLVCYDKLAKSLDQYADVDISQIKASRPNYQTSAADTMSEPSVSSSPLTEQQKFGLKEKQYNKPIATIGSIVAKAEKNPHGKWVITLENSQVWQQIGGATLRIKKGERVSIKRGALNSFLLSREGANTQLRVKRLK